MILDALIMLTNLTLLYRVSLYRVHGFSCQQSTKQAIIYSEKQILFLYIDLTLLCVCFALCLLGSAGGSNLKAQRLMTVVQSGVTERPRSKQQTSGVGFPPYPTPDGAAQDMVSLNWPHIFFYLFHIYSWRLYCSYIRNATVWVFSSVHSHSHSAARYWCKMVHARRSLIGPPKFRHMNKWFLPHCHKNEQNLYF